MSKEGKLDYGVEPRFIILNRINYELQKLHNWAKITRERKYMQHITGQQKFSVILSKNSNLVTICPHNIFNELKFIWAFLQFR